MIRLALLLALLAAVLDGLLHWSWGDRDVTFRRCPN